MVFSFFFFFFSSRRRHTRWPRDWSSDVCSSDLKLLATVLPDSGRLRWALRAGQLARGLAPLLAGLGFRRLAGMLRLAPAALSHPPAGPSQAAGEARVFHAEGRRRGRVALL